MASNLRFSLHKKLSQVLQNDKPFQATTVTKHLKLKLEESNGKFFFSLPLRSKDHDIREDVPKLLKNDSEDFLENVEINNSKELSFEVHRDHFIKGLLDSMRRKVLPPEFAFEQPKNVIVEFSSPNIAKPFHVGHLRSTIIGNYVANINEYFENDVTRINYLGDWGVQFGFIELGLSLKDVPEEAIKKNPIKTLYDAYVHANKMSEEDPTIADKAREIFRNLENGDRNTFSNWELFRKYTVEELDKTYNRIGVKFDAYQWESMYNIKEISNVIAEMERLNILIKDDKNRKVVQLNEKKVVPIIKSDGSSLYMARDIAAAVHRFEQYDFDSMYYVVDNSQIDHFRSLIGILNAMKLPWADNLAHINICHIVSYNG